MSPIPPPRKPIPVVAQGGLTDEEQVVMDGLVSAWNAFVAFEDAIASDDYKAFQEAIHDAQQVLMNRVMRRLFPDYWR